jgi:iron complex outermembrane receptor protein
MAAALLCARRAGSKLAGFLSLSLIVVLTSISTPSPAQEVPAVPPDTTVADTTTIGVPPDTSISDTTAIDQAETATLEDTLRAEPVVVTVTRAEEEALRAPLSISVVDTDDIQLGQRTLTFDEALSRVPGIFAQNRQNFSIGERLSIRGFGARAAFGIRGVKLILDGIPQTLADGQSVSSNIDLASAGRIEVIRGPASSLYGNAAGGVVNILTEPPPPTPTLSSSFTAGRFDLQKYQAQFAGRTGPEGEVGYIVDVNRLDYNGFRAHSRVESNLANARLTWSPDERSEWALILNYNDTPTAESPGSLTRAQADTAPSSANPASVATDAGESHDQAQAGLSYNRQMGSGHLISARLYGLTRDVANPLPFAFIQIERFAGGGGLQHINAWTPFGRTSRLTVGVDLDVQSDDRQNFNNEAGEPGDETLLDQDEQVTSWGIYVQNETELTENVEITLGVRYDRVRFEVDDRLLEDGDDSGVRTLDEGAVDIGNDFGVSPMAAIRYSLTPAVNLYATVATSFQTPTTTELANRPTGAGGFNPDLGPQSATNYEVGIKGEVADRVIYTLAGFLIDVQDELIPFEVPDQPQRQFFRNAGSSQHNGVEASLSARLTDFLRADLAYAYSDFYFKEFRTEEAVFDDNEIPGVPPHRVFAQLGYQDERAIFAFLEGEFVDSYFVDDANTTRNNSYFVASARAGWTGEFSGFEVRPFIGVNNIFDEQYIGSVVVNAVGGRFFEPAPDRNVYGGVAVAYRF